MTVDQCTDIISSILEPRWPQIAPGGRGEWRKTYIQQVVYPMVREFNEPDARLAAAAWAQQAEFPTKPADWRTLCQARDSRRYHGVERIDCPDCHGSGRMCVWVRRHYPSRRLDFGEVRHWLDLPPPEPENAHYRWYEVSVWCGCAATPAQYVSPPEETIPARRAIRAFRESYQPTTLKDLAEFCRKLGRQNDTDPAPQPQSARVEPPQADEDVPF